MRKKIFSHYMILVVVGIILTAFFTSKLAQNYYKYEVEEKLKSIALLLCAHATEDLSAGKVVDYDSIAKKYSKILSNSPPTADSSLKANNIRITFVQSNGKVLGESERNTNGMENHLGRKEIQQALSGGIGSDIRFSSTLKYDFLYIAMPVTSTNIIVRVAVPLYQLKNITDLIWIYTVIGIALGLGIVSLLALKFSSTITKPVKELIDVSNEISVGNYSKRIQNLSDDELGLLALSFNDMASRLQNTMEEIVDRSIKVTCIIDSMPSGLVAVDKDFNVILINSIACETFGIRNGPGLIGINIIELIRNNHINAFLKESMENGISLVNEINIGAMQDKVLKIYTTPIKPKDSKTDYSGGLIFIQDVTSIRKLEQIRTEFVSNVTHELKTPLTSIRGFIETLRNGALSDHDVAERFLEIIEIEAERLYTLINDILYLSEIENKHKVSATETTNLNSLVNETFSILEGSASKKNISLKCEIDEHLEVTANKNKIKQMFINLIDNGIKYNVDNGSITVSAFKDIGKIVITVRDTGIGIPPEHLSRIFERFYRVDKGRSRNMGGTGLGLSIVKHIVNLYNGDINVHSELGRGTEFIITLPG